MKGIETGFLDFWLVLYSIERFTKIFLVRIACLLRLYPYKLPIFRKSKYLYHGTGLVLVRYRNISSFFQFEQQDGLYQLGPDPQDWRVADPELLSVDCIHLSCWISSKYGSGCGSLGVKFSLKFFKRYKDVFGKFPIIFKYYIFKDDSSLFNGY